MGSGIFCDWQLRSAGYFTSRKRFPTPSAFRTAVMHAPRLLAEAMELARQLNYSVREEYLDGAGGGHCFFSGKKWLLLDVTQSPEEQLSDVVDALRTETGLWRLPITPPLAQLLQLTKAA